MEICISTSPQHAMIFFFHSGQSAFKNDMLSMKTLNSNQEDLRRRALMILIISIPKAGERMLPTTPPLSSCSSCEEFKVQCFNFYNPFCVKTLLYVTVNYYCFCFPCKYFLCSYTAVCCPDRCPN